MKQVIKDFIQDRAPKTVREYDRALREAIQYILLLGLWRAGFFEHAAFYGGTALRMLHSLPRFSEDVDFSLLAAKKSFSLDRYLSGLRTELTGFGFNTNAKSIKNYQSPIESAFIKANTRIHVLSINPNAVLADLIPENQLLKVKIEVDTHPPGGFSTEAVPLLFPIPFYVRVYSLPDLFAGKMHCLLFRRWGNRVKGRDWYDMIWFLRKSISLNLVHLEQRMRQSGDYTGEKQLEADNIIELYQNRIQNTNFTQAANDVIPFIEDPEEVSLWSKDFFLSLSDRFRFTGSA